MGTARGWWPDVDKEGQYDKEQAHGTTDVRLVVDSDPRLYVLEFGTS